MSQKRTETRFKKVYNQFGYEEEIQIWVDLETGVNYLFRQVKQGVGITVLVDENGKPIKSKPIDEHIYIADDLDSV